MKTDFNEAEALAAAEAAGFRRRRGPVEPEIVDRLRDTVLAEVPHRRMPSGYELGFQLGRIAGRLDAVAVQLGGPRHADDTK